MSEGLIGAVSRKGFRRRWPVTERTVRPDMIVMDPPLLDQHFSLRGGVAVRYRRNLLALLRSRELAAAGERHARESGMKFVETRDGDRIDGVYRRPLRLASGKAAVIEKSREFTLVPWKPVPERRLGQSVASIMRGASVSFDLARKRGIGIG